MKIEFSTEPNFTIKFRHSKFWGTYNLIVNGINAKLKNLSHFLTDLTKRLGTKVGNYEVRVDITRPLILAGYRKGWKYTFFIDDKEVNHFIDNKEVKNVLDDNGKRKENERKVYYQKVLRIAKNQKLFICTILLYLLLLLLNTYPHIGWLGLDIDMPIFWLFLVSNLAVSICGGLIAMRVSGVGLVIIYTASFFLPPISLLLMLLINGKATKKIKKAGFNVGFLGAKLNEIKQNV